MSFTTTLPRRCVAEYTARAWRTQKLFASATCGNHIQDVDIHVRPVGLAELASAAVLIRESWRQNPDTPMDYTREMLSSWIRYTGSRPPVARGVFDGQRLIAFVAGFPRTFRLNERETTSAADDMVHCRSRLSTAGTRTPRLGRLVRQAKTENYDGTLHYCARGNPSNNITLAGAAEAGAHTGHIYDVTFLMKALRAGTTEAVQVRAATADCFLTAASGTPINVPLFRTWTAAEAEWACCGLPEPFPLATRPVAGPALSPATSCIWRTTGAPRARW